MTVSIPWFIFYGHMLGMSRQETLATRWGEMNDLVACLAIYNGKAKEKKKLSFDQAIMLR